MRKKTIIVIMGILLVLSVMLCLNVLVRQKFIKTYTYTEIEHRGYTSKDVKCIRIDHSYFRRILGFNEWRISVEFEKEPDVFFWFTFKGGKIIFEGVSSEPMIDKDAVIEYSEKFKSGKLLNRQKRN